MTKNQRGTARHAPPQEVRIIGGLWRRSLLPVVPAAGLRPTPNRVRETLFNWLGQRMDGLACLDMFAGTGALGLEAASRGARQVLLIESQAQAAQALRAAIARLKAGERCELRQGDALRIAAALAPGEFDVIFIDPPFDAALHAAAAAAARPLLAQGGRLYAEAPGEAALAQIEALGFTRMKQARAGAVSFALFAAAREPNPPT
jgi:16S rRNA (guanine(966)-N(2))-methyltransferase RsmD